MGDGGTSAVMTDDRVTLVVMGGSLQGKSGMLTWMGGDTGTRYRVEREWNGVKGTSGKS